MFGDNVYRQLVVLLKLC